MNFSDKIECLNNRVFNILRECEIILSEHNEIVELPLCLITDHCVSSGCKVYDFYDIMEMWENNRFIDEISSKFKKVGVAFNEFEFLVPVFLTKDAEYLIDKDTLLTAYLDDTGCVNVKNYKNYKRRKI